MRDTYIVYLDNGVYVYGVPLEVAQLHMAHAIREMLMLPRDSPPPPLFLADIIWDTTPMETLDTIEGECCVCDMPYVVLTYNERTHPGKTRAYFMDTTEEARSRIAETYADRIVWGVITQRVKSMGDGSYEFYEL